MITNEPFLTIPCHYGQSADTAVLAYVRERLNVFEVGAALLPSTYEERFLNVMQGVLGPLLKPGETLTVQHCKDGEIKVSLQTSVLTQTSDGKP